MAGRPSSYTLKMADRICDGLASGLSLMAICAADDMPDRKTVIRWQVADEEFASRCARAREEGVEVHYDAMDSIEADTLSGKLDPKAANVVLSNKRWRLEKLKQRVYGQRQQIDHGVTGTLESLVLASMAPTEPAASAASDPEGES